MSGFPEIPCAELLAICEARCCKLRAAVSDAEIAAGIVRWDAARGKWTLLRAGDGYCVHNEPASYGCDIYSERPIACREFDCRKDPRIWADFDERVPAPWFAIDAAQDV